jgi:hypothetical protein
MDVNALNSIIGGVNTQPTQTNSPIPGAPPAATPATTSTDFGPAGVYTPENRTFTVDQNRVRELWTDHEARVESFRRMIETLLNQQAERQGLAAGWQVRDIEVTDEMRAEANAMIEEGGYFSVEETAARMLDFAVALTGGDPAQIEVMRDAVQRGFAQAERMFGGELPEISHETLQAVMNGFDEWAAAGSASAISLLNR